MILGPDSCAAIIAREVDEPTDGRISDDDRRFDMAITFDRSRVTLAARTLLDHVP